VSEANHPAALAFQFDSIQRDLGELSKSLGGGETGIAHPLPSLSPEELTQLEQHGAGGESARRAFAERLLSLSAAAGNLSDRLAMRHFSHTIPTALAS
jgi:uncharacterized alpha-E superfamily protein